MSKLNALALAATFGLMAALPQNASAEVKIYPYVGSDNYCAAGLQPVVFEGLISCGTPNTHVSYQAAMTHPIARHAPKAVRATRHPRPVARADCPVGTKGCTVD